MASTGNSLYYPPGVVRTGGAAYLVTECGDFTTKYYCCDEDGSRSCCNDPAKNLGLTIADDSFVASTPTQLVGSTLAAVSQTGQPSNAQVPHPSPTQTGQPSSAQVPHPSTTTTVHPGHNASNHSNHNHHAVVIGASTGSSIAAVFIVLGIFGCIWLQRHPIKQEYPEDQEQGVERAAVHEPDRSARVMDWADSALLDSHRDLPSTIHTQSPVHNAFEVNSPAIRRLTSFTHSPPSPLSSSNAESHRRMPSVDQVSAISIGSPHIPYHPVPRTAAPPPAASQVPTTSVGPPYTPYHPPSTTAVPPAAAELESNLDIAPIQVPSRSLSRPPPPAPLELEARDGVTITALWRAASSPDSPHGPHRRGSPLHTMLQGSPTSLELAHPRAEAPTENAGSAESKTSKGPALGGGPLSNVAQSPHPTTERKARLVPTLGALKEGEPSEVEERIQDLQEVKDRGLASEEDNMPSASTVSPETEAKTS